MDNVLVAGLPPGNCHANDVALLDEVLLNCTENGAQPVVDATEKAAEGGVTIVTVCTEVLAPQLLIEVSTT